jgi:hypothetical protein
MKQEDKDLLLKDLCARVPYGVKCQCYDGRIIASLTGVKSETELYFHEFDWKEDDGIIEIEFCKPYLFPLTEEILDKATEESNTIYKELITIDSDLYKENNKTNILLLQAQLRSSVIKYFHIHHIDYNGLIEKGLAIDATELNIY